MSVGGMLLIVAAVLCLAALGYMRIESHWVEVDEQVMQVPGLPAAFDGSKIAFITDLHADSANDQAFMEKQMQIINRYNPDIVLLGGDYADSESAERAVFKVFENLQHGLGVFTVRGNHDVRAAGDAFWGIARASSVTPMQNEAFRVEKNGQYITIAGVDDFIRGESNPSAALKNVNKDDFCLFLAHEPDSVLQAQKEGVLDKVDLAFVGHTHGGQISLFGLWSPFAERQTPGIGSQWIAIGPTPTLYSNGLGQKWNIRFFARPQIHIITLQAAA